MLIAYYDLAVSPPTYDIVAFLCAVEAERLKRGEDRLRIEILPGPAGGFRRDDLWPFDIEGRRQMLEKVALPMARMLPSADVVLSQRPAAAAPGSIGFGSRLYGLAVQVRSMRLGVRPLQPPIAVEYDPRLITITLREAEHWPGRNSNFEDWLLAARSLEEVGWRIVIVRDTLRAEEAVEGFEIAPHASRDLVARAQLYCAAACNLFVNNGPAWFALALDVPALIFRPTVEGVQHACSEAYFAWCGIPPGGQVPGSPAYQRLVWTDDRAQNVIDGVSRFGPTNPVKE